MAATPRRAFAAERILRGTQLGSDVIEAAAQAIADEFTPIDDVRASARYRLAMAQNLLRRALHADESDATVFAHA